MRRYLSFLRNIITMIKGNHKKILNNILKLKIIKNTLVWTCTISSWRFLKQIEDKRSMKSGRCRSFAIRYKIIIKCVDLSGDNTNLKLIEIIGLLRMPPQFICYLTSWVCHYVQHRCRWNIVNFTLRNVLFTWVLRSAMKTWWNNKQNKLNC